MYDFNNMNSKIINNIEIYRTIQEYYYTHKYFSLKT